jgi:hypothetical protein
MEGLTSPQGIIIWLGALGTLALYSILYKENPVYRFAEHVFVGLAAGYGVYVVWSQILFPKWYKPIVTEGVWPWAIALVPGLMYYTVFSKRMSWMSRAVMVAMMGFEAGLMFRQWAGTYMRQIADSFRPLFIPGFRPPFIYLDNVIFIVVLASVMSYFFFSFEHRSRFVQRTSGLGRWLMMIGFGAMFGSTVMARMSLFIGRLWYLFAEWIHLIPKG